MMTPGALLARLEELLVAEILRGVEAAAVSEPVYCLRIWYCGTDAAGDRAPFLMLKKEAARRAVLAKCGSKSPHFLWCADELTLPQHLFNVPYNTRDVAPICREWYGSLAEDLPEEKQLRPIRELTQRVAARLNRLDWQRLTAATDDFVVFAADASHTFMDDYGEMVATIPPDRLELLRSRGLLGRNTWWKLDES